MGKRPVATLVILVTLICSSSLANREMWDSLKKAQEYYWHRVDESFEKTKRYQCLFGKAKRASIRDMTSFMDSVAEILDLPGGLQRLLKGLGEYDDAIFQEQTTLGTFENWHEKYYKYSVSFDVAFADFFRALDMNMENGEDKEKRLFSVTQKIRNGDMERESVIDAEEKVLDDSFAGGKDILEAI